MMCNETLDNVHFVLLLPKANAKDDDSLNLEIQVENANDWEVHYRQGPKYVLYMEYPTSWHEAEKFCRDKNGHLASVKSWLERNQVGSGYFSGHTWIGGSDIVTEGVWTWTDGTPWPIGPTCDSIVKENGELSRPCTSWQINQPSGGATRNCLSISQNYYKDSNCADPRDFACQFNPSVLSTNEKLAIEKNKDGFTKIELWLKKRSFSLSNTCNASRNIPGFLIKWGKNNITSTGDRQKLGVHEVFDMLTYSDSIPREAYTNPKTMLDYHTFLGKRMRYRIVKKAKEYNMTNDELWKIVKSFKLDAIQENLFTCEEGVLKTIYFNRLGYSLTQLITDSNRTKMSYRETNEDLLLSYDIFSYLIFCQDEAMSMHAFLDNLISTASPATILLATINTMKLNHKQRITETTLQHLYDKLIVLMDLRLPDIVSRIKEQNIQGLVISSGQNQTKYKPADQSMIARVSSHPPSVYDKEQNISPSALIPFCSFGAKMIGSKAQNMTFPVCDIFEPTVFQGRLCYQAEPKKSFGQQVFEGKKSGLMMLIDVNQERSIDVQHSQKENDASASYELDVYLGRNQKSKRNVASIHLGTLARYEGHGPGDYRLTTIKQMTGTKNFLAWPLNKRDCSLEKYEKCQMRAFIAETMKCGCSPFQLLPATKSTNKVQKS